ncbi:hypothetical protein E9993_03495 [Labilibacter sediminis]|nr:hypothetical protein E9993_03495 [Labilibacter sediminis]
MNNKITNLSDLIKEHITSIDPYAEVILLLPLEITMEEQAQIYVITPHKVDFVLENQYRDARYKVDQLSGQSTTLFLYSKDEWHHQYNGTALYSKVNTEGIHL